MSLNKKERAEFKALQLERDMYRAMVIAPGVEPDVDPPKSYFRDEFERGWLPFFHAGSYGPQVEAHKAAVCSCYHRTGDRAWDVKNTSWTQNTRRLYSLKVNALRQSRHEAATYYAKQLALADREIEKCLKEEEENAG